jgi:hypothetical protein
VLYKAVAYKEKQTSDVGHTELIVFIELKTVFRSRKERQKNVRLFISPDNPEQPVSWAGKVI